MNRLFWLFILLLDWCLLERPAAAQSSFPSLPGLRRSYAPQFEGWYTRVTANNGEEVIGVVTGAFVGESANCGQQSNSGYVAVLRRHVDTGELEVYEHFPQCNPVQPRASLSRLCNQHSKASEVKWQAEGIGFVTHNETSIQLPCGVSLKVVMHNRRPWNTCFPSCGPEGMAKHLPCLDSHWNVYSLGSDATFSLSTPTGSWSGVGAAHQETNWGTRFPTAYVWSQGSTADGTSCFALAGGK